jgi:hypothetical protein
LPDAAHRNFHSNALIVSPQLQKRRFSEIGHRQGIRSYGGPFASETNFREMKGSLLNQYPAQISDMSSARLQ